MAASATNPAGAGALDATPPPPPPPSSRCDDAAEPSVQRNDETIFCTIEGEEHYPSICHSNLTVASDACTSDEISSTMDHRIDQTMATETAASVTGNQQVHPQQYPPLTYASIISSHPSFLQYDLLPNPQQHMSYEQQQALLFQHHLMVQQVAQQSILLHQLQSQALAAASAAAATTTAVAGSTSVASFQQLPLPHSMPCSQHNIPFQSPYDLQYHHNLALQQSTTTALPHQQIQFMQHPLLAQPQYYYDAALLSQGGGVPIPCQQPPPDPSTMFVQAHPYHQYLLHPYYWNAELLHGIAPLPVGVGLEGVVHQGANGQDNQEMDTENAHDDDNAEDIEEDEDEDDDDDEFNPTSRTLHRLVEDHQWVAALQRMTTHPHETHQVGIQGRTPLHVACDNDAPACVVQALLNAWPEGADRVGTSHMNPLHITCSSPHASVDVVRILLAGCRDPFKLTGAKDVDGDTSLHAACRCAAPMNVLQLLLQANPITVTWKDYEGLNPLMRLWVRYFVLVGEQIISNIKHPSDLTSDLLEAWEKSLLLLRVMDAMERRGRGEQQVPGGPFRTVHAASSVNCPRCVVRIAMVLFPEELLRRDEQNRLPIHIAAVAPVYAVNDLRGEGFTIEDAFIDDDPDAARPKRKKSQSKYKEPSVIDILLSGEPMAARERDHNGQLPLHVAIMRGKTLDEGVQALVEAYPDALTTPDSQTNLYPFMLAASVGRGRGDCGTIYALLRAAPDLVLLALAGEDQDDEGKLSPELELKSVQCDS
jgi:ankyrin repeat protein